MGDMGEVFKGMSEARKERHSRWRTQNILALQATQFIYTVTNNGETFLFREAGKPKVDFYPSTGRWRVSGIKQTFHGGGKLFIQWYRKQRVAEVSE